MCLPAPATATRRVIWSWYLFDWANSAFPTIVLTFVFATYVTQAVAADPVAGTIAWGRALTLSSILIALLGPILGHWTDRSGRRKPWLALLTAVLATAMAGWWWVRPDPDYLLLALVLVAVGNVAFELGCILYNGLLLRLGTPDRRARLSGLGWGIGYAGGLVCLVLALLLIKADPPLFGLDPAAAEPVRLTGPLVAVWFVIFAVPLFAWVPDHGAPAPRSDGGLWREILALPGVRRFLLAYMLYIDGLNTLFAFGGIYAAGSFGLSLSEVLMFGIALNLSAGTGSILFALFDRRLGSVTIIRLSLLAVIALGAAILLVRDVGLFWVIGVALGVFFGPIQSASRAHIAELAPAGLENRLFALLALSGRATSFLGPALLALVTDISGSQRWGMATILIFFTIGLILLQRTK